MEPRVDASLSQKLGMRALLYDVTSMEHQDAVGAADGRQAVSDDDGGTPHEQRVHRAPKACLGLTVDEATLKITE